MAACVDHLTVSGDATLGFWRGLVVICVMVLHLPVVAIVLAPMVIFVVFIHEGVAEDEVTVATSEYLSHIAMEAVVLVWLAVHVRVLVDALHGVDGAGALQGDAGAGGGTQAPSLTFAWHITHLEASFASLVHPHGWLCLFIAVVGGVTLPLIITLQRQAQDPRSPENILDRLGLVFVAAQMAVDTHLFTTAQSIGQSDHNCQRQQQQHYPQSSDWVGSKTATAANTTQSKPK